MVDDDLLMGVQPLQDLASLPIPEDHVTLTVTARDEPTVRRETDRTGITGDGVPCETLFPILSETIGRVDEDLVVQRLTGEPFFCTQSGCGGCKCDAYLCVDRDFD